MGRWECLAIFFVVLTFVSGAAWWHARNTMAWERAIARVTGLSLVENYHHIDASRPELRIHYEFTVNGRDFRGQTAADAITRAVYSAVPPEARELLRSNGYMSFHDLPPEVQAVLRRHGIERLDVVPEPVMETLRAQGFRSVRDFPEDYREAVRQGDYVAVAEAGERLLETPPEVAPRAAQSSVRTPRPDGIAAIEGGGTLEVLYSPQDPSRHKVLRFPLLTELGGPAPMLVSAMLALLYCGLFYPWIKQR